MRRRQARIADHAPEHLVVVAAVNRVGVAGLLEQRIDELVEPRAQRHLLVGDLAAGKLGEERLGLRRRECVEALAELLAAGRIRSRDADLEILLRRERKLVAELRLTLLPRAMHVEPLALAEAAGELAIHEDGEPAIDAARRQVIRRAHDVDERFDERGLVEAQRLVSCKRRGHRCRRGRRFGLRGDDRGGGRRRRDRGGRELRRAGDRRDLLEDISARELRALSIGHRRSLCEAVEPAFRRMVTAMSRRWYFTGSAGAIGRGAASQRVSR